MFEGGQISDTNPDKKVLKIACIAVGAMGHFIPLTHCATALKQRGHDVYVITNGEENIRKKAPGLLPGIPIIHTECGLEVQDIIRKPKGCEAPLDTWMVKWHPFVEEKIKELRPDIVVNDWMNAAGQ